MINHVADNNRLHTSSGTVYAPGLENRVQNQGARTRQGIQSGEITRGESREVAQGRREFGVSLTEAKADDGRVDRQERVQLHRELNDLSSLIYDCKHNGERVGSPAPRPSPVPGPGPAPAPGPRPAPVPGPGPNRPNPLGEKESFDASIVGDPHFSVNGSINGEQVESAFDNQDLGTRTQYQGAGFKLDTTTVPWGDGGAAVVGSATVKTGFGRNADDVSFNATDRSVLVNGEQVSLESGQSMQLNRTSSLAYNEDGTYTVSSRNGKVANTVGFGESENGNYLNIYSSVDDVQTTGWLQNQV